MATTPPAAHPTAGRSVGEGPGLWSHSRRPPALQPLREAAGLDGERPCPRTASLLAHGSRDRRPFRRTQPANAALSTTPVTPDHLLTPCPNTANAAKTAPQVRANRILPASASVRVLMPGAYARVAPIRGPTRRSTTEPWRPAAGTAGRAAARSRA